MCSWHCFGGPGYSWSILQGSHGSWKVVKNEKKIRHVEFLKLAVGPEKRMIFYCGICVGTLILPVAWLQWFLYAPPRGCELPRWLAKYCPDKESQTVMVTLRVCELSSRGRMLFKSLWLRARTRHRDVDTGDLAWHSVRENVCNKSKNV